MSVTSEDLQAFHRFAQARLGNGGAETLHELVSCWEVEHLSPAERQENVAAVKAALKDMREGDTGRDALAISRELRAELASGD